MEGTLRSKDSKEVNENSLEGTNNEEENDNVLPLEKNTQSYWRRNSSNTVSYWKNSQLLDLQTEIGPPPPKL